MNLETLGWGPFFEAEFTEYKDEGYAVGRVSLEHKRLSSPEKRLPLQAREGLKPKDKVGDEFRLVVAKTSLHLI
nr:hypothetical protein [Paenibacillus bovis]